MTMSATAPPLIFSALDMATRSVIPKPGCGSRCVPLSVHDTPTYTPDSAVRTSAPSVPQQVIHFGPIQITGELVSKIDHDVQTTISLRHEGTSGMQHQDLQYKGRAVKY